MVDTKNGDSYDGTLEGCDNYMNIKLKDVIATNSDGVFSKFPVVFIRGNNVKSIQLSDEILENYKLEIKKKCKCYLLSQATTLPPVSE